MGKTKAVLYPNRWCAYNLPNITSVLQFVHTLARIAFYIVACRFMEIGHRQHQSEKKTMKRDGSQSIRLTAPYLPASSRTGNTNSNCNYDNDGHESNYPCHTLSPSRVWFIIVPRSTLICYLQDHQSLKELNKSRSFFQNSGVRCEETFEFCKKPTVMIVGATNWMQILK